MACIALLIYFVLDGEIHVYEVQYSSDFVPSLAPFVSFRVFFPFLSSLVTRTGPMELRITWTN